MLAPRIQFRQSFRLRSPGTFSRAFFILRHIAHLLRVTLKSKSVQNIDQSPPSSSWVEPLAPLPPRPSPPRQHHDTPPHPPLHLSFMPQAARRGCERGQVSLGRLKGSRCRPRGSNHRRFPGASPMCSRPSGLSPARPHVSSPCAPSEPPGSKSSSRPT